MAILGDIAHSQGLPGQTYSALPRWVRKYLWQGRQHCSLLIESLGVKAFSRPEEAIEGADVVYVLRLQLERQTKSLFPSKREYRDFFGLDRQKFAYAKDDAIIMHPGPMNRGVEITTDLADSTKSVILDQVTSGVAIRMAVLYLILGGRE